MTDPDAYLTYRYEEMCRNFDRVLAERDEARAEIAKLNARIDNAEAHHKDLHRINWKVGDDRERLRALLTKSLDYLRRTEHTYRHPLPELEWHTLANDIGAALSETP